jgi:hypothetical protein
MAHLKLVERRSVREVRSFDMRLLSSYVVVAALLLVVIYVYSNPAAADFSYLTSSMPLP